MKALDISVILPINSSKNKNFLTLFDSAVKSISNQNKETKKHGVIVGDIELVIVHSDEESLCQILDEYNFEELNVKLVKNTGETDFSSQMKLGIENTTHQWVSFFEFDDEYSSIWFKNFSIYANSYPEVKGFLPIVIDVDEKGVFAGFTNEATFAANMNTEIGYLTNEVLLNYQNFQTSGMVIDKELLVDFGSFKKNIKLTFVYELLLRLTYNSVSLMTIPKIGYKHMNMREGSIFWNYKNGETKLSDDEVKFWIESAKKEHFFKQERDIKYESE